MLAMIRNERDPLRTFIEDNKAEFDEYKAPPSIWDNVQKEIPVTLAKTTPWKWIGLMAISVVLAIVVTAYFTRQDEVIDQEQSTEVQDDQILEFAQLPDFNETQQYYATQVNATWVELKKLHYDATLEKDLSLLDEQDNELRIELKSAEGIYKEHVLQALIQNQQIKLNLLMDVLNEVKNSESQKNNTYETI
jgi:hypothetical protein